MQVWASPDGDALRFTWDTDEGIYEVSGEDLNSNEVGEVPAGWVRLTPEGEGK